MTIPSNWLLKAAAILWLAGGPAVSVSQGQHLCGGLDGCDAACCDTPCCETGCDALGGLGCDSGCDSGCCAGLGCLDELADRFGRGGWIKPSDRCFDDFISPMINFVYFEDPRTLTELRPIFAHHNVPAVIGNGVDAGGSIQLYAAQFRLALSERLSLIAVKDGYIDSNVGGTLDTLLDSGWADVGVGLKYNFLRDTCRGRIASAGISYEIPLGSEQAQQSIGDGEFHFFVTGGQRFLDGGAHLLSAVGYRHAVDQAAQVSAIHWSNQFDVKLTERLYALTGVTWWHWTDDANPGAALGVGGQDLFSLPANDVAGNDLVTQNVGLRFKARRNLIAGIAYEFPLTGFQDVIENRLVADLILRF